MSNQSLGAIALLSLSGGLIVGPANAATVSPTKSNGDFIAGSGIPGDNFTVGSSALGTSVFLKARGRDTGQPISQSGSTYFVLAGSAASAPSASWWSFDFQFSPSETDTVDGQNYILSLEVDTDPSAATSFTTLAAPLFDGDADPLNSWDDTDGFHVNANDGSWSDNTTDYVFSQSWRMDFSFLAGEILGPGEYEIRFSAVPVNSSSPSETAFTSITVNVQAIPLPTGASMGLVGLIALAGIRRRSR